MVHKHTAEDGHGMTMTEEDKLAVTAAEQEDVGREDFQIKQGDVAAYGRRTSDGFVVFKGSMVKANIAKTCPKNAIRQRELHAAKISPDGILQEDIHFNSPSGAACFVTGNAISGNVAWRTADGETLKKVEGIETKKRTSKPEQSQAPDVESGTPEPEIEEAIGFGEVTVQEERPSIEEIRRIRASDPVPARKLWDADDDALGMTEEEQEIVENARQEDWDYNGTDGYEPPAAKAILDKYAKPSPGETEKTKVQIGNLQAVKNAVSKTSLAASRLFGRGRSKG